MLPIPSPVLFLGGAALLGEWLSVRDAEHVAVVALIVILFNGGMDIGWARMRASAGPVLSLGILGTFATAGIIALAAHALLGMDWTLAGVVGAALAPTDPAVVFSVLGGRDLKGRAGTTLEGEAGVNDPAGIALMLGMIELATHADATFWVVIEKFTLQMGLGAAFGAAGAWLLRRLGLPGLLRLAFAGGLYAVTAVCGGSGFLAVFIAGLALGAESHHRLASVAEIAVFVALGLTVELGGISADTWLDGLILVAVIAVLARPLTVLATLAGARLTRAEKGFIAWSGLKGAVPILLAAFAVLDHVEGAGRVYDLVFVVVLVSVLAQGTLVPALARRLDLLEPER